jgi:hypothetical protein
MQLYYAKLIPVFFSESCILQKGASFPSGYLRISASCLPSSHLSSLKTVLKIPAYIIFSDQLEKRNGILQTPPWFNTGNISLRKDKCKARKRKNELSSRFYLLTQAKDSRSQSSS